MSNEQIYTGNEFKIDPKLLSAHIAAILSALCVYECSRNALGIYIIFLTCIFDLLIIDGEHCL